MVHLLKNIHLYQLFIYFSENKTFHFQIFKFYYFQITKFLNYHYFRFLKNSLK